jgi:hypothetical protein
MTAQDLAWMGNLTQLRGLSLKCCDLRGADFGHLSQLQSLQWLSLSDSDMSADDFATFPKLNALHGIELSGTAVTDEWMSILGSLDLPSLGSVVLYHTSVTDEGMKELCSSYNLKHLDIYGSTNVTMESVDATAGMRSLRFFGCGLSGIAPNGSHPKELDNSLRNCEIDSAG